MKVAPALRLMMGLYPRVENQMSKHTNGGRSLSSALYACEMIARFVSFRNVKVTGRFVPEFPGMSPG